MSDVMDDLRIDTLEARYHLPVRPAGQPSSQGAVKTRLDRALSAALETAAAVARRDLPAGEQVLIRELHVPVRLDLAAGDTALGLAWGDAFAAALAAALDGAGEDGVVRYRNRRAALVDCARGVARGDLRRAWAWRQMELVGEEGERSVAAAALDLARTLAADPPAIVGVLVALGVGESAFPGREDLRGLLGRWPASVLLELTELALEEAEVPAGLLGRGPDGREGAEGPEEGRRAAVGPRSETFRQTFLPRLARALERSRIAPAARDLATGDPARRALAALALLESDPGLLRGPGAGDVLGAAEEILVGTLPASSDAQPNATPLSAGANEVRTVAPSGAAPDATLPGNDSAPAAEPGTGWTQWGGLLFLLHLVADLGLPEEIAASEELAGRGLRWTLHRLALQLLVRAGEEEPSEDDPAALAFAGLIPGAEPPSNGEPVANPREEAVLAAWADRLIDALADRLGPSPPDPLSHLPPLPRERGRHHPKLAVTEVGGGSPSPGRWEGDGRGGQGVRVLRRRARIAADPGWIEVHLSLDDVEAGLRRAGLDLDPGWLPWLGAVVRFVYG